ncbi:hypothetical protein D8674_022095 [Pyrus ussuriensis x Pyrus communis]|uniref:Uncharacterized protein n=1 Tax=Pyrus ussuriensis x Pyrus communis TaxID=2448454 RepID=A0A5N5GK67_9ROSA|nr:hypothetical protein D8674_022095 [Pyrus ussuriensis x Pyrus communis]
MANSGEGSGKKKLAYTEFKYDIGNLVRRDCFVEFESCKKVPEELKKSMLGELLICFDLHQYFGTFDDPQVALEEGCPKEFGGREDNWAWLCSHFQELGYVKKVKANKSNRDKKALLHHSGLKPFSYRMETRWRVIIKSMSLATFMLDPGISWPSPFIQSDIHLPDLRPSSTSEPFQPEHGHTSAPSIFAPLTYELIDNLETFQPPLQDDHVDYAALFS